MDRHIRNSGDRITFKLYLNGSLTDSEVDVTVQVKDGAGVNVGTSATAVRASVGVYEHQPSAAQMALLDTYTAEWTARINGEDRVFKTWYEVVGDFYFTIAEARAFERGTLVDSGKYPTQAIVDEREEIEGQFEDNLGYACVLRGQREILVGEGTSDLPLKQTRVRTTYSVVETDLAGAATTYDATDLADLESTEYGYLQRKTLGVFPTGSRIAVHYIHGEYFLPGGIKRAALKVLKNRLVGSDVSDRALSFTNESGTLQYSTPNGLQRPFGIPEVDALLWKLADHRVGVA